MTPEEFSISLTNMAFKVGHDISEGELRAYEEEFIDWSVDDFRAALRSCAAELDWFPTVKQIKDRRPVERQTVEYWDERAGIDRTEPVVIEGPKEVDDQVAHLTADEVLALFRKAYDDGRTWYDPDGAAKQLADWWYDDHVRWKGFLRELLQDLLEGKEQVPF